MPSNCFDQAITLTIFVANKALAELFQDHRVPDGRIFEPDPAGHPEIPGNPFLLSISSVNLVVTYSSDG